METHRPSMLGDARSLRLALAPIRRDILAALREPGSAAAVAVRLGLPRQTVGYHLRALEGAGLVRLVEERRRRGFIERVLVADDNLVLDPTLLQAPVDPDVVEQLDRHASSHLIRTASALVRDVARMQDAAAAEGARLLTLTVESELSFARPADFDAFSEDLAQAVAELARRYAAPGGRRYRLVAGALPAPVSDPPATRN